MEFTKIISSPVFAASAPDIGLEAQSASPVKIVVTTPSASWDITLSPVSDADGKKLLNIRLRDILSAVASAPDPSETEPNSASPLLMVNLSASNTEGEQASIDIPVAFGTLNGKDPKDFTGQWLTSREQICLTYSWARERLSLIFGPQLLRWSGSVSLTVNCRAYYASGKARNFQLVSAGSSDTVYYSVDCSYSAISALDDSGEQLVAWDLSYTLSGINADGESDSVDSFPQRFILANQDGRIREYIFANCFGMEDRVFGEGVARREVSGSSSTFVNGGKTLEVSNDAEIVYEAFSGQLADRRAIFHWYDFLSSSSRLIFSAADGSMTHIVVEGHDSETDDFSVGGVSFSYRLSEKNGVYPDGLCGTIGDYDPNQQCGALWVGDDPQAVTPAEEDLFFLKHRLSEFQTLTVSDALLLLVQSPATDAWGSVSLGSIKSWVKKFLDGESREIRLNSLADYETADGKVIDPSKLQNGSIPVWDAAAGAYHPVPASELGDYGINPKLYPLVFRKGEDVVLTYTPNVGKAVLDINDFASAETLSTHISDKDIHVTAEQKSAWDLVASLFGVNEEGNIYIKDNRGLISYTFVSVHGSDPEAGSGSAFDSDVMWTLLGADTTEKINISHLPSIPATMVSGLGSATAGKVAHSLTVENDGGSATAQDKIFDGGAAVTVTIPTSLPASDVPSWAKAATKPSYTWSEIGKKPSTLSGFGITDGVNDAEASGNLTGSVSGHKLKIGVADGYTIPSDEKIALWDKICALFDVDDNGDVRVTGGRGLSSDSFLSVHGSDPEAGQGGIGGLDIDAMWDALAESGTQKINASHIPLLQQLSGTLTNAQLANSSLSVAGVSVPLGGAVSTEQIASALGLGSNAYTSTAYLPLAGGTMSGTLTFPTATNAYDSLGVRFSGVSTRIGTDAAGGLGLYAQDAIYLRPSWTYGGTPYGLIIRASDLTYNGYPLLHSGNYTNYTVTKAGGGASGSWGISISGIANRAVYLTSTYTGSGGLQPPSYFNGMGLKVNMMNKPVSYCDVIFVNGYGGQGSDVPYVNALAFQKTANAHGEVYHARADYGGSSWGTWYKFLDEYNYAGILDSRYVKKSGDTMNGVLSVSPYLDSPKGLFGLTKAQADSYAGDAYYNLAVGQKSPSMGASLLMYRDSTAYQSYIVWSTGSADHVGIGLAKESNDLIIQNHKAGLQIKGKGNLTYNDYTLWHAGNDGSGSGLDADLLDGYQATSFQFAVSHNYELSLSGGARGKYVILLHPDTLSSANVSLPVGYSVQGTFHLFRPLGNGTASIIVKSGAGYSSTWNSGSIIAMPDYNCFPSMKLVTCNYGGKLYRALFVDAAQDIAQLYFRGVAVNRDTNFGLAVKYYDYGTGTVTNSEVNGSIADFQYYHSISCPQGIRGNASSATKLATARSIWGQTFDGTQGVDGHLFLGSQDYRLYFGTSGLTALLTATDGAFQIVSANGTAWRASLLRINLSNGALWADSISTTTGILSNGYISCRGADSQAADASSGIDSNALWNVLGAVGTEKINASHLPDCSKTLTCSTAAGTAAKVVTCTGFQLTTGAAVTVRFTSGNSAASPSLNVNGTGAKGIRVYRGTSLVTPFASWNANVTVELTYNGTYWVITGNPVVYSLNAASASDSSGTYYRTARIFADGWKEYAFVTNASGNDRTLAMPYAFSSVNSMGVVVTLFGTSPGAGNVKSKSTSSVTVDFSTGTASTSKRGTVLCFGY